MSDKTLAKRCGIMLLAIWVFVVAGAPRVHADCLSAINPDNPNCSDVYNTSGTSGGCTVYFDQVYCWNTMQYCDVQQTLCEGSNSFSVVISCSCY